MTTPTCAACTTRRASADDLPAVISLYERVIAHMRKNPPDVWWDMDAHPTVARLERDLAAGNLFIALDTVVDASAGEAPAGTAAGEAVVLGAFIIDGEQGEDYALAPWRVPARADEVAVLHLLCSDPAARGRGIGRALIAAAADEARRRGALCCRLDTFDIDVPAANLYRSCGFIDYGIFDIGIGGGLRHASHLMELDVRPGVDVPAPSSAGGPAPGDASGCRGGAR